MTPFRALRVFVVVSFVIAASPSPAAAAEHYALIVTGASGGPQYAQKYETWRTAFVTTLTRTFGYREDRVIVLGEDAEGKRPQEHPRERSCRAGQPGAARGER